MDTICSCVGAGRPRDGTAGCGEQGRRASTRRHCRLWRTRAPGVHETALKRGLHPDEEISFASRILVAGMETEILSIRGKNGCYNCILSPTILEIVQKLNDLVPNRTIAVVLYRSPYSKPEKWQGFGKIAGSDSQFKRFRWLPEIR